VVVFGIASGESERLVEKFRDYTGATFPFLLDSDGSVNRQYSQQTAFVTAAYPQDWIIDPDFKVAYVNNGYEPDEMIAVIEENLAD